MGLAEVRPIALGGHQRRPGAAGVNGLAQVSVPGDHHPVVKAVVQLAGRLNANRGYAEGRLDLSACIHADSDDHGWGHTLDALGLL